MINENCTKAYCCEDISLIENYDKAVADKTQTWDCHHRWETDRNLSAKELIFCSEYFGVPADRLIFLTHVEHIRLHMFGNTNMLGKHLSKEAKQKISVAELGKPKSEETKLKMREAQLGEKNHMFGKHHSKTTKQKMSKSRLRQLWWNNGAINTRSKECPGPKWKRGRL